MDLLAIADELSEALAPLKFGPPVTHVYNPLVYARASYAAYVLRFGGAPKEVLLVGMNPGPFGMTQTGVPFGDVTMVRDWLGISAPVARPDLEHPRRPVLGFGCTRREVSGTRLWGWARSVFQSPETFFARFFVANYCPLVFMDAAGRNVTPDKIPRDERVALLSACDAGLARVVRALQPRYVVGIGAFATARVRALDLGSAVKVGCISHPSPANPNANRGWDALVTRELEALGIVACGAMQA